MPLHMFCQDIIKSTGIVNDIYEGTDTAFEDKDLTSGKYVYTVKAIVDENDADANFTAIQLVKNQKQ